MKMLTSMCQCALPDVVATGKRRLWMRLFPSRRLYHCCTCDMDLFIPQALGDDAVSHNGAARFFGTTGPPELHHRQRNRSLW